MKNINKTGQFCSESELVAQFVPIAQNSKEFRFNKTTLEWSHSSGSVDVLGFCENSGELFAIEAKLTNWRKALLQAYRNTSYAHRAYVLLPKEYAHRAEKRKEEFSELGIGLCSFDGKTIKIIFRAKKQKPILRWLREKAIQHFKETEDEFRPRSGNPSLLPI